MLRDVNINLSDGALASAVSAVGIHAKIGASPVTASEAIVIRSSMLSLIHISEPTRH